MRLAPILLLAAMVAGSSVFLPASAADDTALARMALCQDSWIEWSKSDPARFEAFRERFMSMFSRDEKGRYFVPKAKTSVAGLGVLQAFPDSTGMGVGFSFVVDATFDEARKAVETALGKPLGNCESGEGMRACELQVAAKRTVMLMAGDDPKDRHALIGCYYFYEK